MHRRSLCSFVLALVFGCDPGPARCIEGSTAACLCPGGEMGVQSCNASGSFDACACAMRDGGLDEDAGSRDSGSTRDAGSRDSGSTFDGGSSGPRILRFDTDVTSITMYETVTFTLIATDPDGIDDVIGGVIEDPVSGATYGALVTSAAEGAYTLSLSWSAMHAVRAIEFTHPEPRELTAEIFDVAGNTASARVSITLTCGADRGACDGRCTDLTSTYDCGACGNQCLPAAACVARSCTCDYSISACGPSCAACASEEWCDGVACRQPTEGDVRLLAFSELAHDALQIFHEGVWAFVFNDGSMEEEAVVACRQLGGTYRGHYGSGLSIGTPALLGAACTGAEVRLADCPRSGWATSTNTLLVNVSCALP